MKTIEIRSKPTDPSQGNNRQSDGIYFGKKALCIFFML